MPYAGEDDDSCSSISDDFPCFKGRLDCKKKYDIKSPQESPSSASVSSDEQPDAETDTKHSDSTEDGRHSNCSCCSDESRKSPLNFRREQPLDGQGPNLDAASRNSLHDQNPSKEKESKQHQDDPSSGGTHFNMSNKNMSSLTQALVPRDEQPIAEATVTCLNALPEHGSCSSISNYLPLREKKFPLDEQYPDSDTENQNFLSDYKASKNNYETERHQGSSSVSMSIFNLSIAIMGSGILGLSFAMANTGIALFVILLVIFAIFSLYSVHLLLKTADEAGALVYESLGYKAFGIPGKLAASCSITMQNIGAMSSYLYIIKKELPIVIQSFTGASDGEWYINGDYLVILVSIIVILPLSLLRNLGYLGYTSGLSLLCMVFFLIVVIIKKFQIPCPLPLPDTGNETMNMFNITPHSDNATIDDDTCKPKYFVFNSQTAYAIPILTFAFVCHPTILPMYEELKDRSRRKMQNVASVSFLAMFIMYLLAALFGYLTFNIHVGDELLHTYSNYYKYDILLLVVRLAVLAAVTLTVPVVLFPIRTSVGHLLFPGKDFSWIRHAIITLTLLTGTNILVIFVPSIRDIFGFIGASAAAMLIFILPSAFYIKLVKKESMKSMKKIGAMMFLILGFVVMIGCMSLIIYDWIVNSMKDKGH